MSYELRQRGYGPLLWLQERNDWDGAFSPEPEDQEMLIDTNGSKKPMDQANAGTNGGERRDSGGTDKSDVSMEEWHAEQEKLHGM